jgi:hypothetical protein
VLVPVHGFVRGDTLGLVVLVQDTDSIAQLGQALLGAATVRIGPATRLRLYHRSRELSLDDTVARAGINALDRIDLVPEYLDELP